MPEIVTLPHRGRDSGLTFTAEQLDEIHGDLQGLNDDQAVVVSKVDADGKPFTKDATARNYARAFANAYQERFDEEVQIEDDGSIRRLLSTHAVPMVNANGKSTGKYMAAVSNNTRPAVQRVTNDGPPRSDLMREVREWRKAHPRDRSFRNYTKWPYDKLRERVNAVTGYNDGTYTPAEETPENGANAPENGTTETGTDTDAPQPENTEQENAA